MKQIVSLSSIALVSLSSVAPCLATTEARSRSSNQSFSSAAKTTQLAQFGGILRTIDQGLNNR